MNKSFYIHCSSLYKVMMGKWGLSENQQLRLDELESKKDKPIPLTPNQTERVKILEGKKGSLTSIQQTELIQLIDKRNTPVSLTLNQQKELDGLIGKRDNPKLGATTRSMVDEILVQNLYGIEKDMHSKYTAHGNFMEEPSIEYLNAILKTNFKKYEGEAKFNDDLLLIGTPDILVPKIGIDMKNPFDTFTFNKKRDELEKMYYCQGQGYCELYDREEWYVVYMLNENINMQGEEYKKLAPLDRLIVKKITRDREFIESYKERLPGLIDLMTQRQLEINNSIDETRKLLLEIKSKAA